jgi:tetratricopeptide (TPR) repeat protein
MVNRFTILTITVCFLGCGFECNATDVVEKFNKDFNKNVELANNALKSSIDKAIQSDAMSKSELIELISKHDFKAIDKEFDNYQKQYDNDVQFELFLYEMINIFTPKNNISIKDLDLWVDKTGSYTAYAARGLYKYYLGNEARGTKYISETPTSKIEAMQKWHNEAAKDLLTAIKKKPSFMFAYNYLISIATMSNMSFTPNQIFESALKVDKRSYLLRSFYIGSLTPRWGGSYEEMTAFAESQLKYINLNPRIWTLQGDAYADIADLYRDEENFPSAIEYYTRALQFGDNVQWLTYRHEYYQKLRKWKEAGADNIKLLKYSPPFRFKNSPQKTQ